jgi:cyclophilin family peptidyl-prolyl cis-trans isomerase
MNSGITMISMPKRLIAAAIALTVLATPSFAPAQDEAAPPEQRQLLPVNFNQQEDLENILYIDLSTGKRVTIRLMPSWAPNHVARIKELARSGFYDGVVFHRVIEGFMAQTGDPTGTGQGGSWLPDLEEEFNMMPHIRGSLSMARADAENSANSQFFIVFYPRFALDRRYTNFGRVIAGMDAVDEIQRGEPPTNPTKILQASIAADNKPQKMPEPVRAPASSVITADMLNGSPSN